MYGNPAFDCAGARLHAVCRQLATVVTVEGVVDDSNIERVTALAQRFVIPEKAYVLDLSAVESFSAHGISLLSAIDRKCFECEVEWAVIANDAVSGVINASGLTFPTAATVADAMHEFAAGIDERRRLLPLLTKKTA